MAPLQHLPVRPRLVFPFHFPPPNGGRHLCPAQLRSVIWGGKAGMRGRMAMVSFFLRLHPACTPVPRGGDSSGSIVLHPMQGFTAMPDRRPPARVALLASPSDFRLMHNRYLPWRREWGSRSTPAQTPEANASQAPGTAPRGSGWGRCAPLTPNSDIMLSHPHHITQAAALR
jgi:hypothetical protein